MRPECLEEHIWDGLVLVFFSLGSARQLNSDCLINSSTVRNCSYNSARAVSQFSSLRPLLITEVSDVVFSPSIRRLVELSDGFYFTCNQNIIKTELIKLHCHFLKHHFILCESACLIGE